MKVRVGRRRTFLTFRKSHVHQIRRRKGLSLLYSTLFFGDSTKISRENWSGAIPSQITAYSKTPDMWCFLFLV
jgi:hypothetical protein